MRLRAAQMLEGRQYSIVNHAEAGRVTDLKVMLEVQSLMCSCIWRHYVVSARWLMAGNSKMQLLVAGL